MTFEELDNLLADVCLNLLKTGMSEDSVAAFCSWACSEERLGKIIAAGCNETVLIWDLYRRWRND